MAASSAELGGRAASDFFAFSTSEKSCWDGSTALSTSSMRRGGALMLSNSETVSCCAQASPAANVRQAQIQTRAKPAMRPKNRAMVASCRSHRALRDLRARRTAKASWRAEPGGRAVFRSRNSKSFRRRSERFWSPERHCNTFPVQRHRPPPGLPVIAFLARLTLPRSQTVHLRVTP